MDRSLYHAANYRWTNMIDRTITRANSNEDLRNMVCKSRGVYGFLGPSWVLTTMMAPRTKNPAGHKDGIKK